MTFSVSGKCMRFTMDKFIMHYGVHDIVIDDVKLFSECDMPETGGAED